MVERQGEERFRHWVAQGKVLAVIRGTGSRLVWKMAEAREGHKVGEVWKGD